MPSAHSSYGHSRSDGTQYVSPVENAKKTKKPEEKKKEKKPEKKVEKPAKEEKKVVSSPKPIASSPSPKPAPKPGKAAVAYSAGKDSSSAHSSPVVARSTTTSSTPEVVSGGLNKTTYEKQPDWAFSERDKNASGQYRHGQFQGSDNPNNAHKTTTTTSYAPKPATTTTSSASWSPKPATTTYNKSATTSSYSKPTTTTTSSPKPAALSYRVGGESSNASSSYGGSTGANTGAVKSGLNATTYEKQPDWAYSERHKNANGQYQDSMFQKGASNVSYGSSSASPSQLRSGGHLR